MKKKIFSILFALVLVLSFSLIPAMPAMAATINVPGDHATIQEAIDAASAGDTINVADGTYTITEAITVDKGVTITGNTGSPSSVLVTYAAPSQTLDCFDMQANDTTVQGIKVVNGRYGFNFATSDPTGCTISDCVIDHCYEGAINIDGGSGHTISDNTITHCLTSGTKSGVIYIYGCPDTTIDGNTLTDNGLTGAHATMGIYVKFTYPSSSSERVEVINNNISGMLGINADIQIYDAPYTYIYNNTISNSEDKGITVFGIHEGGWAYTSADKRVEVIGNTISSTYYPGLQACNAPYTYFYNNTLTHCNYYGDDGTGDFDYASIHIDIGSAHCLIDSNTVSDGINGIQLWSDDCTVTSNTIYDMGKTYADTKTTGDGTYYNSAILYGDMYDVNMPTSATISYNNIYDNYWGLFVISAYTGTVTAENNWWGDATGPYHATSNPGGTGDEVSDNVNYCAWLGASYATTPRTYHVNETCTIQSAIDEASAGDTINVAAGTYDEQIAVGKPLTLQGATYNTNKNGYTVPGSYAWDDSVESVIQWTGTTGDQVIITSNNVTFEGFIVCNLSRSSQAQYGASHLVFVNPSTTASNITIKNNVIGPNTHSTEQDGTRGRMGLYLNGHSYDLGCTVTGNKIFDALGNGNGIMIWGTDDYGGEGGDLTGTIIQDNEVCGNHRSGIEVSGGISNLVISDNDIHDNGGYSTADKDNQKYGNGIAFIRDASDLGEDAKYIDNVDISNNSIHNNEKTGIYMGPRNQNHTITGNDIFNNGSMEGYQNWDGICVDLTEVYDGRPIGNAEYDFANNIVANYNNIHCNGNDGTQVIGTPTNDFELDATNNWWGANDGPSGVNPGSGDAVSANVDYDPWLTHSYVTLAQQTTTATGSGTASFYTNGGGIEDLTPIDEATLPEAGKPDIEFPHGLFSFNICCLQFGETVTVAITLPDNVPVGTQYWKYHANEGGWIQIPMGSDDGDNIITITLTDGGLGDNDGLANGTIDDPGGPAIPPPPPPPPPPAVGGEVFPVNKLAILAPWLGLALILAIGGSILMMRRRRAN